MKWELRKQGIKISALFPARVDTSFFDSYERQPSRWQLLPSRDLARYIAAIATRSWLVRLYARLVLLGKRILALVLAPVR